MVNNMKEIRTKKEMQLREVSKKTGLSIGFLSHLESGTREPSVKSMKVISKALDEPVSLIFPFEE